MLAGIKAAKKALDKIGITYWLDCGTLLFAIRENRSDPTDIDLSIFLKDKNKLLANLETFYNNDIRVNRIDYHPQYGIYIVHLLHNEHGIDIFIRQEKDDCLFTLSSHEGQLIVAAQPRRFFDKLDKFELDGLIHNVPHNPKEYLEYYYGKDWETPIPTDKWDKTAPPCVENGLI
jgi:phosphorylcholine metabolism protein LicD